METNKCIGCKHHAAADRRVEGSMRTNWHFRTEGTETQRQSASVQITTKTKVWHHCSSQRGVSPGRTSLWLFAVLHCVSLSPKTPVTVSPRKSPNSFWFPYLGFSTFHYQDDEVARSNVQTFSSTEVVWSFLSSFCCCCCFVYMCIMLSHFRPFWHNDVHSILTGMSIQQIN